MLQDRTCRQCRASFQGGSQAYYCPSCRTERTRKAYAEHKRRKRQGKTRTLGSIDICERCGKPYTVNAGIQRFCPDCQSIHAIEYDRAYRLKYYNVNKDTINPKRNQRRKEYRKKNIGKKRSLKRWTKELVIERILERAKQGLPLNAQAVQQEEGYLYGAAVKHVGTWEATLIEAGVDPTDHKKKRGRRKPIWTKELVIQKIQDRARKGLAVNAGTVQCDDSPLYQAARIYIGSWKKALEESRLDPEQLKPKKKQNHKPHKPKGYWTEEKIHEHFKHFLSNTNDLSPTSVKKANPNLYTIAVTKYGSWGKFLYSVVTKGTGSKKFEKTLEKELFRN